MTDRERGRLEKKIRDQRAELDDLRRRLGEAEEGARQTALAADAVLAAAVLRYGGQTEGGRVLTLPPVRTEGARPRITARRREDGGMEVRVEDAQL